MGFQAFDVYRSGSGDEAVVMITQRLVSDKDRYVHAESRHITRTCSRVLE